MSRFLNPALKCASQACTYPGNEKGKKRGTLGLGDAEGTGIGTGVQLESMIARAVIKERISFMCCHHKLGPKSLSIPAHHFLLCSAVK